MEWAQFEGECADTPDRSILAQISFRHNHREWLMLRK
jgi:hypothetical protein